MLIIEPRVFNDERGYFFESFNARAFAEATGLTVDFVQDNESQSARGVVRGLHFQREPYAQSKLVRCVQGCVRDVAVDLREDSATYGQHVSVDLSADNHRQLFIPRGCAHGFAVLSDTAIFQYKCDNFYAPASEGAINALDPALAIDWGLAPSEVIQSGKDQVAPKLMREE